MGNLFSKPKAVEAPKLPPPEAIPQGSPEAGEQEAKRIHRQMGFQRQILTGALTPSTGKKTTLGY